MTLKEVNSLLVLNSISRQTEVTLWYKLDPRRGQESNLYCTPCSVSPSVDAVTTSHDG